MMVFTVTVTIFLVLVWNNQISQANKVQKSELQPQKGSDSHLANLLFYVMKNSDSIKQVDTKIQEHEEKLAEEIKNIDQEILKLHKNLEALNRCPALLPVKWRGHCYGLFRYKLTFHQAQSHCRVFGADLVWIEDRAEQNFLVSTFSPLKLNIWIGCNDISHEGRFVWVHNNKPITFSNWYPGQPSNFEGKEDCCMMGWPNTGKWNDCPCYEPVVDTFICKK